MRRDAHNCLQNKPASVSNASAPSAAGSREDKMGMLMLRARLATPTRWLVAAAFCIVAFFLESTVVSASPCDAVKDLKIEHTVIDVAEARSAGAYTPPGGAEIASVPAFCRVHGIVS